MPPREPGVLCTPNIDFRRRCTDVQPTALILLHSATLQVHNDVAVAVLSRDGESETVDSIVEDECTDYVVDGEAEDAAGASGEGGGFG